MAQGGGANAEALFGNATSLQQFRPQVLACNLEFFFSQIACQPNAFHAVEQRPRDGIELVGGTHKQHLGQVKAHIQIVIEKFDILLRIKHLQ